MTQERARRASAFGAVAGDYAASRPSYPPEAISWLAGPDPADVVDLGAGTGKLTELLVAAGHRVTAVDTSADMLAELHRRVPGVPTATSPAESVALPDGCCDVITVAQAWHWFDPALAAAECGRLLRPGGRLSVIWNERDETVAWVAAAWAPQHRVGNTGSRLLPEDWRQSVAQHGPFGREETAVFRHAQTLTPDGLLRLIASQSNVAVLPPDEQQRVLTEVEDVLATHPDVRGKQVLTVPYEGRCNRWTRSG